MNGVAEPERPALSGRGSDFTAKSTDTRRLAAVPTLRQNAHDAFCHKKVAF